MAAKRTHPHQPPATHQNRRPVGRADDGPAAAPCSGLRVRISQKQRKVQDFSKRHRAIGGLRVGDQPSQFGTLSQPSARAPTSPQPPIKIADPWGGPPMARRLRLVPGPLKQKRARPAARPSSISKCKPYFRLPSIPLQASTRPLTALTELSNIACSSLFMEISTTRSIPPAPITVGTPT